MTSLFVVNVMTNMEVLWKTGRELSLKSSLLSVKESRIPRLSYQSSSIRQISQKEDSVLWILLILL